MQRGWRWTQASVPDAVRQSIVADTVWQKVGKLAQQGVYEFHHDPLLLKHPRGIERLADRLYLYYEIAVVRQRVLQILHQYRSHPWLLTEEIIVLNRGDEPLPAPIDIQSDEDRFQLFAAFDCLIKDSDGRLHVVDFKTGQADFDRRQADVYLLAISYLYPDRPAAVSFYNLETNVRSEPIVATPSELTAIARKLAEIARLHQHQLHAYHSDPDSFDRLFPPHPGNHCRYCKFNYLCTYASG